MSTSLKEKTWQPSQNRPAGWLLTLSGFLIFVSSAVVAIIARSAGDSEDWLMLLVVVMFFGGAVMVVYGKRHLTLSADVVLARDTRPPIIYLRSFDIETGSFGLSAYFSSVGTAFTNRSMGWGVSPWDPTFQTQLSLVMGRIGPYIAVGRPGEKLPGTGAARLYIPDSEWQQRVTELIRRSRLVVIRAGSSPGLQWELDNLMRHVRPRQLLVLLPASRDTYRSFRELMEKRNIPLPEKQPDALLMTFLDDWKPVFLKAGGNLESTLDPYFRANSIPTPKHSAWDAVRLFFR
jgi:hypothetical protein